MRIVVTGSAGRPRNIYGTTKVAAEDLCELVHRDHRLPVVVLRTARFFPEPDDDPAARDARGVLRRVAPDAVAIYERLGWRLPPTLQRVYSNDRARRELGWDPIHDFAWAVDRADRGEPPFSDLALAVGSKGYHRSADG